jgi:hypothetical protein
MFGLRSLVPNARRQAINALSGEPIVYEGRANLLLRGEGIGGWLVLSPRWLVFASHRLNFQRGQLLLPIERIQEATPSWVRLLGIPLFPTILAVRTKSVDSYKFVVYNHRYWAKLINRFCKERLGMN